MYALKYSSPRCYIPCLLNSVHRFQRRRFLKGFKIYITGGKHGDELKMLVKFCSMEISRSLQRLDSCFYDDFGSVSENRKNNNAVPCKDNLSVHTASNKMVETE